ncbi:MAG: HD domain-containing protein, partial [Gammaproteobacteria bacterium]
ISTGRRLRRRLHPRVDPAHAEAIEALLVDERPEVRGFLRALGADPRIQRGWLRYYPGGIVVEVGLWQLENSHTPRPVELGEHLQGVAERAKHFATTAGLSADLIEAVTEAARRHDVGKAEPRFQLLLGATPGKPLAKSGGQAGTAALAGLPRGWRHEMMSVAKVGERTTALVRYLIGTHHGRGRPLLPAKPDPALYAQAHGPSWATHFDTLSQRYGPWGLAYLEALVRLADWAQSEAEQQ